MRMKFLNTHIDNLTMNEAIKEIDCLITVSYTHLTLPTNSRV